MSQYYVLVVNLYRHYTVTVYDSNKVPDSSIASHLTLQMITQSVILYYIWPCCQKCNIQAKSHVILCMARSIVHDCSLMIVYNCMYFTMLESWVLQLSNTYSIYHGGLYISSEPGNRAIGGLGIWHARFILGCNNGGHKLVLNHPWTNLCSYTYFFCSSGLGIVWVSSTTCDTSRACFTSCFKAHTPTYKCNHTEDVAVQCSE